MAKRKSEIEWHETEVIRCSRCDKPVPGNPFSERDQDRLAPRIDNLQGRNYDTVHCFYSELCDILHRQMSHPYLRALCAQWYQERHVWPQYIPQPSPPRTVHVAVDAPRMEPIANSNNRFRV